MRLGFVYDIPPEPLDAGRTRFVAAGAIRVGVERRAIDDASLRASFAADEALASRLEGVLGGRAIADGGVSLHVCGAEDGHEYLRFDCFEREPHYHYSHRVALGAPAVNHWVPFDRAACGEMLPWALERIRSHLPEMLREAHGEALVPLLDPAAIGRALVEIERLARERC
jgi:hypothetical protein